MCYRESTCLDNCKLARSRRVILGLVLWAVTIAALLSLPMLAGGCAKYTKPSGATGAAVAQADQAAAGISEPLIRAEVRREAVAKAAEKIVAEKPAEPVAIHAGTIAETAKAQKADIQEARHAVDETRAGLEAAQTTAAAADAKYLALRGEWYVRWGLRIEAACWWLAAAGVVFLIGSILKDTALASGWGVVFVLAYRAMIGVLSGGTYFLGLIGRAVLARWYPKESKL
jgi:hypothetical protein